MKIKIIFTLLLVILLQSCGEPDESTERLTFFSLVTNFIERAMLIKNDIEKQKEFLKESKIVNTVINVEKKSEIYINSKIFEPSPEDIAFSLDDNVFKLNRPLYISTAKKKDEMIFSLDGSIWYSTKSDLENNIENSKLDYIIESKTNKDGNKLYITYSGAMQEGRFMIPVSPPVGKTNVSLQDGMTFAHTDKKKVTIDLNNYILFLPIGTKLSGRLILGGNLATSESNEGQIIIKFIRDIYIYIKGKMFSLSFDNKEWGFSILSFNLSPEVDISSCKDNCIFFDMKFKVNYKK